MHFQLIAIFICLAKYLLLKYVDSKKQPIFDTPPKITPPINPEIVGLQTRKNEILATIQQFNNPSTFAKYSKFQRELIKIDKLLEELIKKNKEENDAREAAFLRQKEEQKKRLQEEEKSAARRKWIVRLVVNLLIIQMLNRYSSEPVSFATHYPLSLLANENGELNCGLIYLAASLLLS